jgi:hypothetical protein
MLTAMNIVLPSMHHGNFGLEIQTRDPEKRQMFDSLCLDKFSCYYTDVPDIEERRAWGAFHQGQIASGLTGSSGWSRICPTRNGSSSWPSNSRPSWGFRSASDRGRDHLPHLSSSPSVTPTGDIRHAHPEDGKHTPACKLIEACYQFMAGNVPASDITAQQGDLIFIQHPNDPVVAGAKVEEPLASPVLEFESHRFELASSKNGDGGLKLYVSKAKQPDNRLGFLYTPEEFRVKHPEHMNIDALPAGWYEIRRCKSWEANPKAIWSRTID